MRWRNSNPRGPDGLGTGSDPGPDDPRGQLASLQGLRGPHFAGLIGSALGLGLGLLVLGGLAACTGTPTGVEPVQGFNLARYLGTWHEIARLDHSFERGLTHVTATYDKRKDGGVSVLNRGFDPVKDKWKEARGHAYFLQGPDVASLKVSFFGPFYGGYHVFALDPDYRWAMVAGPTKDYLWILAREPQLPPDVLANLIEIAGNAGFDTGSLIYPPSNQVGAGPPTSAP
jgi:apolipoprotein D and lipocalin family protein